MSLRPLRSKYKLILQEQIRAKSSTIEPQFHQHLQNKNTSLAWVQWSKGVVEGFSSAMTLITKESDILGATEVDQTKVY